jgi:hypothetical protein
MSGVIRQRLVGREEMMWTKVDCCDCVGHGVVSVYSLGGTDFDGAGECRKCGGTGEMWLSPQGRLAEYPGGKFLGSVEGWHESQ